MTKQLLKANRVLLVVLLVIGQRLLKFIAKKSITKKYKQTEKAYCDSVLTRLANNICEYGQQLPSKSRFPFDYLDLSQAQ